MVVVVVLGTFCVGDLGGFEEASRFVLLRSLGDEISHYNTIRICLIRSFYHKFIWQMSDSVGNCARNAPYVRVRHNFHPQLRHVLVSRDFKKASSLAQRQRDWLWFQVTSIKDRAIAPCSLRAE